MIDMTVANNLIGRRIAVVRPLTSSEMTACGWSGEPPIACVLSNGELIVPARDADLSGPGCLFSLDKLTGELSYFSAKPK